ncbi:hypothetical protein [Mucilaginibacter flavidus]|uniref:hypothetical protein n=1 Tax=Mucilaginibacter flavidus TaxID=2949309 RepID=UPI002092F9AE|nr:hypothetical protein [Mucilaginibacter flavidus]MCO5947049.1 hypothetical protein [Mucilaginibacter flavidus]
MRKLLYAFFLISTAFVISSWICAKAHKKGKHKFLVTGSIMQTVGYCGGARPTQQILDSCNKPRGIRFAKLFVRSGRVNIEGAPIIKTIDADEKGNFKVSLPAGSYCLVEEWKSGPFKLPLNDSRHTVDSACYRNLYNTCDFELKVTNENIHNLKITFHRACFYKQPCISYSGRLPSVAAPRKH